MNEPVTLPPVVDPPGSAAILLRWAVVVCFFALVITMTFDERTRRGEKDQETVGAQDAIGVRMALQMESMARFSEATDQEATARSYHSNASQALTKALDEARPQATKSVNQAAFFAGIATALKKEVPANVLARLKQGRSKEAKALAEIYSSMTIPEPRSRQLAQQVSTIPEIGGIAAYQALEKGGDPRALEDAYPKERFFIFAGIAMVMIAGLIGGVAAWVVYFANHRKDTWWPLDHPFTFATRDQSSILGLLSVGLIGLFMVNGETFNLAFNKMAPEHVLVFGSSFIFILLLLAIVGTMKVGGRTLYGSLNQSPMPVLRQVAIGVAGWGANLPVLAILMILSSRWIQSSNAEHPMNEMLTAGGGPAAAFALFFAGAVVAPIWEEIAFRGALFGGLRVALSRFKYGLPTAIFLTSFAFAAIHPQGPALWLILGWIGAMGCFLTYRTRSIIPAITMHAVHNGTLFLMSITLLS